MCFKDKKKREKIEIKYCTINFQRSIKTSSQSTASSSSSKKEKNKSVLIS
jgi:hypothetical protein